MAEVVGRVDAGHGATAEKALQAVAFFEEDTLLQALSPRDRTDLPLRHKDTKIGIDPYQA